MFSVAQTLNAERVEGVKTYSGVKACVGTVTRC